MNPLDRIKQIQAALARAEDELSTSRAYLNELHGEHDKAVEELAALRARVAEQYAMGYDDKKPEAEKEATVLRAQIGNWKSGCDNQRTRAESATPLPMREDPRYRGTDFRSAIDVDRASQGGGK